MECYKDVCCIFVQTLPSANFFGLIHLSLDNSMCTQLAGPGPQWSVSHKIIITIITIIKQDTEENIWAQEG